MSEDKPTVKIKNWHLVEGGLAQWLNGNVDDHPRFQDGALVHTSRILNFDRAAGSAETLNTHYILVGPEAA